MGAFRDEEKQLRKNQFHFDLELYWVRMWDSDGAKVLSVILAIEETYLNKIK